MTGTGYTYCNCSCIGRVPHHSVICNYFFKKYHTYAYGCYSGTDCIHSQAALDLKKNKSKRRAVANLSHLLPRLDMSVGDIQLI